MDLAKAAPWLALARVPGVGPTRFATLVQTFGHPQSVLEATPSQLARALRREPRLSTAAAEAIAQAVVEAASRFRGRYAEDPDIARDLEMADHCGADAVGFGTPEYPERLARIPDPPPLLYRRGRAPLDDKPSVAIVGSRQATGYGRLVAERLAADLAGRGITVISGLARGIDAAAHRGALAASGPTVAVLGCGIDIIYPPEHRNLFQRIIEQGLVLSELAPGTPPEPQHFPRRNRIISGLSLGVVVVEAAERSGALITADFALEQGRDVFAVPGNVTSRMSRGPHQLLREGARMAESVEDILEELGLGAAPSQVKLALDAALPSGGGRRRQGASAAQAPLPPGSHERRIYDLLGGQPQAVDELAGASGLGPAEVQTALLFLELRDLVAALPGPRYIRKL